MPCKDVAFLEKKDVVKAICKAKGIGKRFRYSRAMVCAIYQLVLAVRQESIDAAGQYRKIRAVTTSVRFRYAGRDYEMSVCERFRGKPDAFCWVNIQTLPRMGQQDLTHKELLNADMTYEDILSILKELSRKNSHKISAHSQAEQQRKKKNRQKADSRKRASRTPSCAIGTGPERQDVRCTWRRETTERRPVEQSR